MARYVIRSDMPLYVETPLWDDNRDPLIPSLTVDGRKEVNTGLVTACGKPIHRVQDPIGFGREKE